MIFHFVDAAVEQLNEHKARCNSEFVNEQVAKVEAAIREAAEAVKQAKPISMDTNLGGVYANFIYDLLTYQYSQRMMDSFKEQAFSLCKWFGNSRVWKNEESFGHDDRTLWTSQEHLAGIIGAYNCLVKGVNLSLFIKDFEYITEVYKGKK